MSAPNAGTQGGPIASMARTLAHGVERLRGPSLLGGDARLELRAERHGGHPADLAHGPHLDAAVDWLVRAQNAAGGEGIARGYSLTWNQYFRLRGWEPAYPETTGYIIPTLFLAAHELGQPELADRAERAARWEIAVQLPCGAVQGGVIGEGRRPAVFNTGQVLLGWLCAAQETGCGSYLIAARRAAEYLFAARSADGLWHKDSPFALASATLYNARTAWALAEAGRRLGIPAFIDAAAGALHAVARRQHSNGWLPDCCLTDPERPLLHTIAYAIRGLLEGGRVLEDEGLIARAELAADEIAAGIAPDGRLAGRFLSDWSPAVTWSCLTGAAQIANVWMRLSEISGDRRWIEPAGAAIHFLKSTQNRVSADPGLRGGIRGSFPMDGPYGQYEVLSWATKFFADALMRHRRLTTQAPVASTPAAHLA
ncbi:MAG: hypothetical protein ACHQXA_01785 [Gemmatimonadales bacterium]